MLRELILFKANVVEMAEVPNETAPNETEDIGVDFSLLEANDCDDWVPCGHSLVEFRQRLSDGEFCLVGRESKNGKVVSTLWMTEQPVFIEWIACHVTPLPDHFLLYNAWVDPAFRGKSIHWESARKACEYVALKGSSNICAGVEIKEFEPFARKYAEIGLACIQPYASLWALTLFRKTVSVTLPPRPSLVRYSQGMRERLGLNAA